MITINFTILIELTLFLLFLWVSNKLVVRPLLKTIDARDDKIEQDKTFAETARQEAKRLDAQNVEQLTRAHQDAAQRLHKARFDAYHEGRAVLDQLREKGEKDVAEYRAAIEAESDVERRKLETLVPELVELADKKLNKEGSLL
jgi:F-type H+-transporting ATPase subunit b